MSKLKKNIMNFLHLFSNTNKPSDKPIVLNCYTSEAHVAKYAPIRAGKNFFPEWWKTLPNLDEVSFFDGPNKTNMRHCTGFIDLYKNTFVLPLWSDLVVEVGSGEAGGYRYQFSDTVSSAINHPEHQFKGFVDPAAVQHVKLHAPWEVVCDEDINWVAIPATFNSSLLDYTVLPGVVNFKYMHAAHPQVLFYRPETGTRSVYLQHNTPLYMYAPMSDRPVEIKTHLVTQQELDSIRDSGALKFTRNGMYLRNLVRKQTAQCPFGSEVSK